MEFLYLSVPFLPGLTVAVAYLIVSFLLVRFYFRWSKQHKAFYRLIGRSTVLAALWAPFPMLGVLLVHVFLAPTLRWQAILHKIEVDTFPWFVKAWIFYFAAYSIAMLLRWRSIKLGTWE